MPARREEAIAAGLLSEIRRSAWVELMSNRSACSSRSHNKFGQSRRLSNLVATADIVRIQAHGGAEVQMPCFGAECATCPTVLRQFLPPDGHSIIPELAIIRD